MPNSKSVLCLLVIAGILIVLADSIAFGQISHIQVSNFTSSSATVTWTTPVNTDGCVNYGVTTSLGNTACDARPNDDVHYVVITGLSVATTHYFEVASGGVTDNNSGAYYTFTTADVGSGVPYVIFGYVRLSDAVSPAVGTIVTVRVKSGGNFSSALSVLTNSSGVWSLNLGNLKSLTDGNVFAYHTGDSVFVDAQGAGDGAGNAEITVSGSSPQNAGTIVLQIANQAPVLDSIGPKSVAEGSHLGFRVHATDPDGTIPSLSAVGVPTHATFVDSGNGSGGFVFDPDFTQAGIYPVTFKAGDGILADSEVVVITVTGIDQAPVLDSIGPKSVAEGSHLGFRVHATDPDGTIPSLSAVGVPTHATFVDSGNGSGGFVFDPDFTQAGIYPVTFKAGDGILADSEVVVITVTGIDQAPVLDSIGPKSVAEGSHLGFRVHATDPDGTIPSLSAVGVPTHATFVDSGNGSGGFVFDPDFTQAGIYPVTFKAGDGILADSEVVVITVTGIDQAPVLDSIGPKSVAEGSHLGFRVHATDPDGTIPSLSAVGVPTHATFVDSGNGSGGFVFDPDFTQAGIYPVTFKAGDGILADSEVVVITVTGIDQAPVLDSIGPKSVAEGSHLGFRVHATDPDGTIPSLSAVGVPTHATFVDSGNGSGGFVFDPDFTQAGIYPVTFKAGDGILADSEVVVITVTGIDQAPVLDSIGPKSVAEGSHLGFRVHATDPDGTIPSLSAVGVPTHATFVDSGNGSGGFVFDPDFTQAGIYPVTFKAGDGILADSEVVVITVTGIDQAPVLDSIGPKSVAEGSHLGFRVHATDPDGTIPSLSAVGVPTHATFVDSGNGSGGFVFDPDFTQAGIYPVTFKAGDGILADSEVVVITVTLIPQLWPIAGIPDTCVYPGKMVCIPVYLDSLPPWGVYSAQMVLHYDAAVLEAISAETQNSIAEFWGEPTYNIGTDQIAIAMAGATPLATTGVLVWICFNVVGQVGDSTLLEFKDDQVILNDSTFMAREGVIRVCPEEYEICGQVRYCLNDEPVDNTQMIISGGKDDTVLTDADGIYKFEHLLAGLDYCMGGEKVNDDRGAICAFDASMVLRYVVGLKELSGCQMIAGDVTGNCWVNAYDASFILKHVVGLITQFPIGRDWKFIPDDFDLDTLNWCIAPDSMCYDSLSEDLCCEDRTTIHKCCEDWKGILYGDVSGNWSDVLVAGGTHPEDVLSKLVIKEIGVNPGEKFIVPIEVKDVSEVYATELSLTYDNSLLSLEDVVLGELLQGYYFEKNLGPGEIRLALAGASPIQGSGKLIYLTFKVLPQVQEGITTQLEVSHFCLNETSSGGFAFNINIGADKTSHPLTFGLFQNNPNPFNPETEIGFVIPSVCRVEIKIYNVVGQLVKVYQGEYPAGTHQISWDGTNMRGENVGSGIYFYRMEAGSFVQQKKMVLTK